MPDAGRGSDALRSRLRRRPMLAVGALIVVFIALTGADVIARALLAENPNAWVVSTNNTAGGQSLDRLAISGDIDTARIQVKDSNLQLATQTLAPSPAYEGMLWYDSTTGVKKLKYFNNTQWVEAGVPVPDFTLYEGRLTLASGTPVSLTDQNAKTTVYFTPYRGNRIGLYGGSSWNVPTFTELSLSLSGWTVGKNSDLFIYDNSGTPALERAEWTNDTTRATALTTQDGVLVKSGATTRRYLGTIRTSASGECEDSQTKRYVWNYANRVNRFMLTVPGYVNDADQESYTTSSSSYVQANSGTGSKLEFVIGLAEDSVAYSGVGYAYTGTGSTHKLGVGEDNSSVPAIAAHQTIQTGTIGNVVVASAYAPAAGYRYLNLLIAAQSGYSVTYYADSDGSLSPDPKATYLTATLRN